MQKNKLVKYLPNLITISRILGSITLLFIEPFSFLFLIVYFICGLSDVLDGLIARKMNLVSKTGQLLDSIADLIMLFILMFVFSSFFKLPMWSIYWIGVILIIRLLSLLVGFIRYKKLTLLHTYANKLTGLALFCVPFLYVVFNENTLIIFICSIASISSIEELIINSISKTLHKDIKSIMSS